MTIARHLYLVTMQETALYWLMNVQDMMIIWILFQFNVNLKTLCVWYLVAELGTDFS